MQILENMKTILKLLVACVAVAAFVSCGAKAKKTEKSADVATENSAAPIHLTKADFLVKVANFETDSDEWKYLGDKPAIVDYYADWCGPCKTIAPILDSMAVKYAGQIYVYKVNIDEEKVLGNIFGVTSVPTLLFIPMEGIPRIAVGALPEKEIVNAIETVLLGNDTKQESDSTEVVE